AQWPDLGYRHRLVERVNRGADGSGERTPGHGPAPGQMHEVEILLRIRAVRLFDGRRVRRRRTDVAGDADDRRPIALRGIAEANALADGIAVGPVMLRHRRADGDNGGGLTSITLGEKTAA